MKRATLYSRTPRTQLRKPVALPPAPPLAALSDGLPPEAAASAPPRLTGLRARLGVMLARHPRGGVFGASLVAALLALALQAGLRSASPALTQDDIDAAVLHTLETRNLPSRAARAAAAVMPSVVRVRTEQSDDRRNVDLPRGHSTGTGLILTEDGSILTSLHVVVGAARILVTFHDGSEVEARLVSASPAKDLAVLKASKLPDDIVPATLRPVADLSPGDEVVAVGFPFGIGPSVSAGVVSGLGREHRANDGRTVLSNLIQFDAAANPGNSGGPLITMDGQVVGIVAAIMNPTDQAVFIGIGLAVPIEDAAAAVGVPPA